MRSPAFALSGGDATASGGAECALALTGAFCGTGGRRAPGALAASELRAYLADFFINPLPFQLISD